MAVTPQQVRDLRDRTGVAIVDCKRALDECGGDLEAAVESLRRQGLAKAAKKASRETREGRIAIARAADERTVAMVEMNCETDFVARNDEFRALAEAAAAAAAAAPVAPTADSLLTLSTDDGRTLSDRMSDAVHRIGENIRLGYVYRLEASQAGRTGFYLHHNARVGVVVALECGSEEAASHPAVADLAKNIAMHIAMAAPEVVSAEDLSEDRIARERELLLVTARQEKPDAPAGAVEKIVEGRLAKFREEACLLEQPYIRDEKGKTKVGDLVREAASTLGTSVRVSAFKRYSLDERAS